MRPVVKPSVVYLRPRAVTFVRMFGPYEQSSGAAWDELLAWLARRGLRDDVTVGYGLVHDDPRSTEPEKRRYDACVELSMSALAEVGGEMRAQYLPGGAFVRSRVSGGYEKISDVLSSMRDEWLPLLGLRIDRRRPVIAVYLSDPRFVPANECKADICLPVDP